jgi:signal peptidase II
MSPVVERRAVMPDARFAVRWRDSGWRWLWLSLLVLVLDQLSKLWVMSSLELYQRIELMPMLDFTLVYNRGAAFSFLSDASGWQRWFFAILAVGISVAILIWMRRLARGETRVAIALALILGGAIGNVWDRMLHGHVVDFILVYYRNWYWPAFNVADSAIFLGVTLLLLDSLLAYRRPAAG